MRIMQHEKAKLKQEKLRPGCQSYDGKFICRIRVKDVDITGGRFDTIAECNEKFDELIKTNGQ